MPEVQKTRPFITLFSPENGKLLIAQSVWGHPEFTWEQESNWWSSLFLTYVHNVPQYVNIEHKYKSVPPQFNTWMCCCLTEFQVAHCEGNFSAVYRRISVTSFVNSKMRRQIRFVIIPHSNKQMIEIESKWIYLRTRHYKTSPTQTLVLMTNNMLQFDE